MNGLDLVVAGLVVLLLGGFAAVAAGRDDRVANAVGAGSAMLGSLLAGAGAVLALFAGASELSLAWSVPYGSFSLALDALSALFALPAAGLGAVAALFGMGYLPRHAHGKRLGPPWLFYNLLVGGMLLVEVARNGVLFLVAWEVMSLAAYFLVTFDGEDPAVRRAGYIYLIATQFGTACLMAFFAIMGSASGSLDFAALGRGLTPALAGASFVLALCGFGAKAGLVPFHVWLPEAHPAAPSHVSAVMSGAMIKVGLYGVVRTLFLLGAPRAWWGWTLVALGLVSALLGVLSAVVQRDLKRMLAFSTVENAGIVCVGLGLGVVGRAYGHELVAAFAWTGALLHVLNHAVFKGALFLAAGSVKDRVHTLSLDALGGLWKRMPTTGRVFLAAAVSGSALPPMAGFAGEVLIVGAAFIGIAHSRIALPFAALALVIAAMALVAGCALAAYARAFGAAFLGEPRRPEAAHATETFGHTRSALGLGGLALALTSLALPTLAWAALRAAGLHWNAPGDAVDEVGSVVVVTWVTGLALCGLVAGLAWLRSALLRGREVTESGTWDCGYAEPTARMQYTATSFGLPLGELFRGAIGLRARVAGPHGWFPRAGTAVAEAAADDVLLDDAYAPAGSAIERGLARLKWIQHGRVQYYVLYVALTLLALLAWKFGR